MAQAFPEKNEPPGAAVAVLERVDALIADMKPGQNFQCDSFLRVVPGQESSHFFRYFAGKCCFIHSDHIRPFLIISDGISVGAILKNPAL